MKSLFFKAILALTAFIGMSSAFAQCGGMNLKFLGSNGSFHCSAEEAWASDRARANLLNNNGVAIGTIVQREPVYIQRQFVPVTGVPGQFVTGGNTYRCPALAKWGGIFLGALVGNAVGKNITIAGGTMSAGGAVIGGVAGQDIACELVQSNTVSAAALANQGGTVTTANQCAAGLSWKKLDWEGHPQHGQFACLPSDQVIAQQKADRKPASSGERVCTTPGTSWKKLDWEGHPQHGQFACLPSDQVIAQQKAAATSP